MNNWWDWLLTFVCVATVTAAIYCVVTAYV